eukprot:351285-Chlamydomonas_euryale.AAC.4
MHACPNACQTSWPLVCLPVPVPFPTWHAASLHPKHRNTSDARPLPTRSTFDSTPSGSSKSSGRYTLLAPRVSFFGLIDPDRSPRSIHDSSGPAGAAALSASGDCTASAATSPRGGAHRGGGGAAWRRVRQAGWERPTCGRPVDTRNGRRCAAGMAAAPPPPTPTPPAPRCMPRGADAANIALLSPLGGASESVGEWLRDAVEGRGRAALKWRCAPPCPWA